jgi:hypothetical protein
VVLTNCGVTTLKTEKINMKYAIVETWNGEGYSSENLAYIKEFNNDSEAQNYLESLVKIQTGAEDIESSLGCISYEKDCDQGAFTFIRNAEELYGVMIYCNVNEIHPIKSKKEFHKLISSAITLSNPEEFDEINLSDDSIFIGAYQGEYDYQFIKF